MDGKPEKIPEEFKEHAEILSAVECLEESNYTAEQLRDYDKYWDAVRCEKTLLIGRFHEGHAEGRVEGRVEGLAEGLEKGRAESAEKIAAERAKTAAAEEKAAAAAAKAAAANRNTARALKAAGVSPEVIAQSIGIPAAEIAKL
jgi:flagellar biosynthesis/type III secretory pathway protein FliH